MTVEAATQAGRAAAESLMVDACTITKPGTGSGPLNPATGKYDPAPPVTLYAGRCRVQVPNVAESVQDSGDRAWTVQDALVMLPVVGSESVLVGHTVTITAATLDSQLVGKKYTVTASHHKSHATARRLRCKEVA